jgi:hypothetical protein
MLDILAQQVAAPVQFVKGLRTLYNAGARLFVEVGPKKALQGFAEDVLGEHGDVVSLFTNHPKVGDIPAFNQALCCLYAAGIGPRDAGSRASNSSSFCPGGISEHSCRRRGYYCPLRRPTGITMSNSAACSPMFSSAAGRLLTARGLLRLTCRSQSRAQL